MQPFTPNDASGNNREMRPFFRTFGECYTGLHVTFETGRRTSPSYGKTPSLRLLCFLRLRTTERQPAFPSASTTIAFSATGISTLVWRLLRHLNSVPSTGQTQTLIGSGVTEGWRPQARRRGMAVDPAYSTTAFRLLPRSLTSISLPAFRER